MTTSFFQPPVVQADMETELKRNRREMRRLVAALGTARTHDTDVRSLLTDQIFVLSDELRRLEDQIAVIERAQAAAWLDDDAA